MKCYLYVRAQNFLYYNCNTVLCVTKFQDAQLFHCQHLKQSRALIWDEIFEQQKQVDYIISTWNIYRYIEGQQSFSEMFLHIGPIRPSKGGSKSEIFFDVCRFFFGLFLLGLDSAQCECTSTWYWIWRCNWSLSLAVNGPLLAYTQLKSAVMKTFDFAFLHYLYPKVI